MAVIRHIGLKAINGPLIILDNIENQQNRQRLFYIFLKS